MQNQDIKNFILAEMAVITLSEAEQIDCGKSLYDNGINSIKFVELLLAIQQRWQLDYLNNGTLSSEDITTLQNLINRIARDLAGR
jgi:hypothetical protein